MTLLDDPEKEVWEIAYAALSATAYEHSEHLQQYLYRDTHSPQFKDKLERVLQEIHFLHCGRQLLEWKNNGGEQLLEALVHICHFKYTEVHAEQLKEQLETLRLDAWLEFHYDLTSFEKVKILNYILFQLHGFRGDEDNFLNPDNSYINKVLEYKKGNPISLSIVYMLVAQRLNVPVYGINLPRHFIMAYVEDEETANLGTFNEKQVIGPVAKGEIQFYINAYNGGGVFNRQHLLGILQEMQLEEKPEYMMPCTNADIVLRVLMNLYNAYSASGRPEAAMIDKVIALYRS